jgi:hypothetical protein
MKSLELDRPRLSDAACAVSELDLVVHQHDERLNGHARSVDALISRETLAAQLGRLAGFTEGGLALVQLSTNDGGSPIVARSTIALKPEQIGSEVLFMLAGGDPAQPVVVGCIVPPEPAELPSNQPIDAQLNGRRLELTAQDELVLRCGSASITLTKAGKVLIRGTYVLSRSSGVNRIKGGSVQIN